MSYIKNILVLILLFLNQVLFSQTNLPWVPAGLLRTVQFTNNDNFEVKLFGDSSFQSNKYFVGNATIGFDKDKMQFATDGYKLFNYLGDTIEGGGHNLSNDSIYMEYGNDGIPVDQLSITIPKGNNQFYILTSTMSDAKCYQYFHQPIPYDTFDFDEIRYSIIDMNANGGKGKVIVENNLLLKTTSPFINKSNFSCTRHANGRDWWIVKSSARQRQIKYIFLATPDSIYLHHIQNMPKEFSLWCLDNIGQSCFNNNGTLYAECNNNCRHSIYNFDRCTGELSLKRSIDIYKYKPYYDYVNWRGVCFSPNGRFLYTVDNYLVFQIDLWEQNDSIATQIVSTMDTSSIFSAYYSNLALTPTGRIFIGNWGLFDSSVNAIMEPDNLGINCNFKKNYFVDFTYIASPPNLPNYELGALEGSLCDTVRQAPSKWILYPNPSNSIVKIKVPKSIRGEKVDIIIVNILGQIISDLPYLINNDYEIEIPVFNYSSGIYFLIANYKQDIYKSKFEVY